MISSSSGGLSGRGVDGIGEGGDPCVKRIGVVVGKLVWHIKCGEFSVARAWLVISWTDWRGSVHYFPYM